jgi:hypothetical protein
MQPRRAVHVARLTLFWFEFVLRAPLGLKIATSGERKGD